MSCDKFNTCVNDENQQMNHPTDENSLYNDKIYDDHTANNRCYTNNPVNIVEGFNGKNLINCLIKWIIIILIVYVIITVAMELFQPNKTYRLNIATPKDTIGGSFSLYR